MPCSRSISLPRVACCRDPMDLLEDLENPSSERDAEIAREAVGMGTSPSRDIGWRMKLLSDKAQSSSASTTPLSSFGMTKRGWWAFNDLYARSCRILLFGSPRNAFSTTTKGQSEKLSRKIMHASNESILRSGM